MGTSLLKVTYRKSAIGCPHDQADTLRSLGLRRLNHWVIVPDSPTVQGMIRKVRHLVTVEPAGEATGASGSGKADERA